MTGCDRFILHNKNQFCVSILKFFETEYGSSYVVETLLSRVINFYDFRKFTLYDQYICMIAPQQYLNNLFLLALLIP